jgi:hypothetical protein
MSKINYFLLLALFFFVEKVHAADPIGLDPKKNPGGHLPISGDPGADFAKILKNTINILFAVGAMAFTIMIVWGAVDWILSGGDKEKIAGARKRIVTAITGLVLLSLSFVIMVVLGQILNIEFLQTGRFVIPALYNR